MDEILLTHAEQKAVRDGVRWSGSFKDLHDRIDEALCRAQVRKVAWWSEGECKHDSKRIRRCCDLCWRDVKAAGEGK